jgi:hypothetical protein
MKYSCDRPEYGPGNRLGHEVLCVYKTFMCYMEIKVVSNTIHPRPGLVWFSTATVLERQAKQGTAQFGHFKLLNKQFVHSWQQTLWVS